MPLYQASCIDTATSRQLECRFQATDLQSVALCLKDAGFEPTSIQACDQTRWFEGIRSRPLTALASLALLSCVVIVALRGLGPPLSEPRDTTGLIGFILMMLAVFVISLGRSIHHMRRANRTPLPEYGATDPASLREHLLSVTSSPDQLASLFPPWIGFVGVLGWTAMALIKFLGAPLEAVQAAANLALALATLAGFTISGVDGGVHMPRFPIRLWPRRVHFLPERTARPTEGEPP